MALNTSSSWAARREGTLNKFYTRATVGDVLVSEVGDIQAERIVDLGAGEGSLSAAVARRWPAAHITTVDVDQACAVDLHATLASAGVTDHVHRIADVLDPCLVDVMGDPKFDLAVCNPPFFRPTWRREFADILQAARFAEACPTISEATAEILFFAQNLRLVRDGGTIAFIVPDGLATSWRTVAFRQALLDQHTVRSVIQLPRYSFHDTESYCFVLIVTKGRAKASPVKLLRLDAQSRVSDPIWIDHKAAVTRLDWTYHSVAQSYPAGTATLRELGAEIRRGSLSTVERRAAQYTVFHTCDFPAAGDQVTLQSKGGNFGDQRIVLAERGDILMARVDRKLHKKITFVTSGRAAITDCVYRIRLPAQFRKRAFMALSSDQGQALIQAASKGVGARLLGKSELLDLQLMLPPPNDL